MSTYDQNIKQIDQFEEKMIAILSTEGRIPVTELAARVGLSKSPCQARLKRLEERGIILGYRAVLSAQKLGQEHICFAEVRLTDTRESALAAFNESVLKIPEIEQCHMMASSFDYLLKIRTRDIQSYRKVLAEKISTLPHVASTSTYVSMQAVKDTAF